MARPVVTEERRFAWHTGREPLPQIMDILKILTTLPPGARVREVVVVIDQPVPLSPGGTHGGP